MVLVIWDQRLGGLICHETNFFRFRVVCLIRPQSRNPQPPDDSMVLLNIYFFLRHTYYPHRNNMPQNAKPYNFKSLKTEVNAVLKFIQILQSFFSTFGWGGLANSQSCYVLVPNCPITMIRRSRSVLDMSKSTIEQSRHQKSGQRTFYSTLTFIIFSVTET